MKTKIGFTLIELIGVIMILGVLAVITTPIILNVVSEAKDRSDKNSVYGMIDGAYLYYSEAMLDSSKQENIDKVRNIYEDITIKGTKTDGGSLYVNPKGKVALTVVIRNKCYYKDFDSELEVREDSNECTLGWVGVDEVVPTIELMIEGTEGNNAWYISETWVHIKASDQDSGVSGISYCISSTECEPSEETKERLETKDLLITDTKGRITCAISYDKAGNSSEKKCTEIIKVDTILPIFNGVSDIVANVGDSIVLTNGVTAEDNGSGIDGTFTVNPSTIDTSIAGTKEIIYTVSDVAGNTRTLTRKVIIDADAPTISYSVVDATPTNGWYNKDFYVKANIQDNSGTGIKETTTCVSTSSSECTPTTIMTGLEKTFYVNTEGNNRMCIKTIDNNNKEITLCSDTYKLDKTAPALTVKSSATETITEGDNITVSSYFNTPTYGISGTGSISCTPVNTTGLTVGTHIVSCTATGNNGLVTTTNKSLLVQSKLPIFAGDTSRASKPELADKMIPVAWNGSNWVYTNTAQTNWYNYNNREWANAVILNNGITKTVGQTISESEIALWFVWIPRYEYILPAASLGTTGIPQAITIKFIDKNKATADGGYKIHPGFTFGADNKNGIWFGKFESSTTGEKLSNTVQQVIIKPNVQSWTNVNIVNAFTSSRNIQTEYGLTGVDSHMAKYLEWTSVSYLTNSIYGRCKSGTTCEEVSRNDSEMHYTGRSDGTNGVGNGYSLNGTYTYETELGRLASTTGNIYGVYDMSGGAYEYVMGFLSGYHNYNNYSGLTSLPEEKYYDIFSSTGTFQYEYSYLSSVNGSTNINGVFKELLGNNTNALDSWYGDSAFFLTQSSPWFALGGNFSASTVAGVFYSYIYAGLPYGQYSFRITMTIN